MDLDEGAGDFFKEDNWGDDADPFMDFSIPEPDVPVKPEAMPVANDPPPVRFVHGADWRECARPVN
jgi:hypothetical protein